MSLARKPIESREEYDKRLHVQRVFDIAIVGFFVVLITASVIFAFVAYIKEDGVKSEPSLCRQGFGDDCPEPDSRSDNLSEPYEDLPY